MNLKLPLFDAVVLAALSVSAAALITSAVTASGTARFRLVVERMIKNKKLPSSRNAKEALNQLTPPLFILLINLFSLCILSVMQLGQVRQSKQVRWSK